jgi:hypothetical protein
MDRFALEHNLRDASARVVACRQALLSQRLQVRELERSGLDASVARALLEIYEESKEMALFNHDCLAQALSRGQFTASVGAAPSIDEAQHVEPFVDDFDYREAA